MIPAQSKTVIALALLFAGCQENPSVKEEFEMKNHCSELRPAEVKRASDRDAIATDVFYSPKLNTCLTATWGKSSYEVSDLLNGETVFSEEFKPGDGDAGHKRWRDKIADLKKPN